MKTNTINVNRFTRIPGVGALVIMRSFEVPQAESREDVLNLFAGTIKDKETGKDRPMTEEEVWEEIKTAANRYKTRQVKASQNLTNDPRSKIASFKATVRTMAQMLYGDDATKEQKEQVGKDLVEKNPKLKEQLEAEGVQFGDPDELHKEYVKARAESGESNEVEDEDDDE